MSALNTETGRPELTRLGIFVVLLIPLVWTFEASAIGPDLDRIAAAFPSATELQVKLVMTVPLITAVLFSALSGRLTSFIDRKIVLISGLLIYGVTGVLPVVATSIDQLLVLRLLTGIGVGLVSPIPNAIITERFEGERQRRMLGMTSSISNVANVIASIVSGMLLVYGWQYPFYSFLILFPIALLSAIGVPAGAPMKSRAGRTEHLKDLPRGVFWLFAFMTLSFAIQAIITTSLALFMSTSHIGAPWTIGVVLIFPGLACFLLSPFYPELVRVLGSALTPISFAFYGAGYLVAGNAHSVVILSLGALLVGVGNALITPHILALTDARIRPSQRDVAYGLVTAGIAAGIVLSPFAQALLQAIGSNSSPRYLFLAAAALAAGIAVLTLPWRRNVIADPTRP